MPNIESLLKRVEAAKEAMQQQERFLKGLLVYQDLDAEYLYNNVISSRDAYITALLELAKAESEMPKKVLENLCNAEKIEPRLPFGGRVGYMLGAVLSEEEMRHCANCLNEFIEDIDWGD